LPRVKESQKRNNKMEPSYLSLYKSGELAGRVAALEKRLEHCDICPRQCGVNRRVGEIGFCQSGYLPVVSSYCAHFGEEPTLSGNCGSGTVFFGNCNMACVYCQNHQISQDPAHQMRFEVTFEKLAAIMLQLQNEQECHNINLVSPTHFVPQIVKALAIAVPLGLRVPLVYNTGGYDAVEIIRLLDGIVDIYLPDLRYADDADAVQYSAAPGYVAAARTAIREMWRQTGELKLDARGIAEKGLIVRLLILPNGLAGVEESLRWLAGELSPAVTVSVMSQYSPQHRASGIPLLSRSISNGEYAGVLRVMEKLGMENGWLQELSSINFYLPDFNRNGHPFELGRTA
jgi:putative pyruvate formate lyase activating enzyme